MDRGDHITTYRHVATTLWVLFLASVFVLACVEEETPDDVPDMPAISSRGIITASLNRYIEVGSEAPFEQFGLTGVFARFPRKKRATVDLLWDNPLADIDLALDHCTAVSPMLDDRARIRLPSSDQAIELMDIGNLSVIVKGERRPVPTRTFPDLLKAVVGVIYAADETQGVVFSPGDTYGLYAVDTNEKELFHVALEAPEDLGTIKVNGTVPEEDVPILSKNRPVRLKWSGDGFGDEVILTISWTSMGSPWEITCRMRDDGAFVIPSNITANLPDPLTSSDEEVSIHRVRQVVFRSKELENGSFRFVVSTHFPIDF